MARSLRGAAGPHLRGRRWALVADLTAITALGVVALYQAGLLRHLPDAGLHGAASDRVAGSPRAYWALHTPDAALGIASYAATIVLATAGGAERYRSEPWLSYLFAAKLLGDGVVAAALLREELRTREGMCSWCLVASAAALVAAPLGIPEALAALRGTRVERRRQRSVGVERMTRAPNACAFGGGLITLSPGQSVVSRWGITPLGPA